MARINFQDMVGVVTGGASGIGEGLAQAMRVRGMDVVIADLDAARGQSAADAIGAHFHMVDVADAGSVATLADFTMRRFGRVDMVCNNAGVGPASSIADMTLDDWRWMLDVNLWGVIHGIHAFLPLLRQAKRGFFLNTASLSGLAALPGRAGYATAKFGVVALTEVLAAEMALEGANITATVLCPGPTRTGIAFGSRHRKLDGQATGLRDFDLTGGGGVLAAHEVRFLEPREVAELCFSAMERGDLYVQTHPELASRVVARHREIEKSFEAALPARLPREMSLGEN
ncbi:SDR family NAD(P)-dependent oxidoreductase [Sphingomonas bisphenolicum]|uniref:Short-chain type dehydrogenase/reductase n=1 Tax=Sphingomonas bisphenolicum TaxID=296544 RepID=A0ABN5WBX5_9SPHN|nr:SDR family NAD(P)-dependent oxidoreductase [Sphingomonas bisphenolicum]BBF69794.1 short-chain type dehydrogenase/reductase [Sphingomonas bisphenolicum]